MTKETADKINEIIKKEERRRNYNQLLDLFGMHLGFDWLGLVKDIVNVLTKEETK